MTKARLSREVIVAMAGDGATNQQIAHAMGITVRTLDRDRAKDPGFNAELIAAREVYVREHVLAPCGTPSAYNRHCRYGEPIDDACRAASTDAHREWSHRKRAKLGLPPVDPNWRRRRRVERYVRVSEPRPRATTTDRIEQAIASGWPVTMIMQEFGLSYAQYREHRERLDEAAAS